MAACIVSQPVSQCVKLLVYTSCVVHIFLLQKQIRFICGTLMPYNVGNIMWVGMLGQRSLRGPVEWNIKVDISVLKFV